MQLRPKEQDNLNIPSVGKSACAQKYQILIQISYWNFNKLMVNGKEHQNSATISHLVVVHSCLCAGLLDCLHGLKHGIHHHFHCPRPPHY